MHELSIARSLVGLVRDHAAEGMVVKSVHVRVGPLQAIDPGSMQLAWRAATDDTVFEGTQLSLVRVPWELRCRECGRGWSSENWSDPCTCGSCRVDPVGGDELTLVSIEVDETSTYSAPADAPRSVKPGQASKEIHRV